MTQRPPHSAVPIGQVPPSRWRLGPSWGGALAGEAQSAGAQLKLLSSNPYLSDVDRARAYVENVVTFVLKGVRGELSAVAVHGLVVPGLALAALLPRDRRPVAGACLAGALAWTLLASFNNNSPFHNFRYYAPAFLLMLVSAGSGAAGIARSFGGRLGPAVAGVAVATAIGAAALRVPVQVKHFTRAAGNIRDQQIEVASRLRAAMEPGTSVLVGDAGAIIFVAERPALDALGLGGYHTMPFARAAVNGEASTLELIERLAPSERPRYMALYPNWFQQITSRFGVEIERVTIADNLICAGPTKVIYRADWGPLEVPHAPSADVIDEVDVADVISEAEHAYVSPVPNGGWTTLDILADASGTRRFDGGRIVPAGGRESFVIRKSGDGKPARVVVRVDAETRGIRMHSPRGTTELVVAKPVAGTWAEATGTIDAPTAGDAIVLEATSGLYKNYHLWITR